MARSIDRRIGLSRGGRIQYVVAELAFKFIYESPSGLHVCNTYHNILITLYIADNGKISQAGSTEKLGYEGSASLP